MGVSENRGTVLWGPFHKDPTIWGTILGPLFSETPHFTEALKTPFRERPWGSLGLCKNTGAIWEFPRMGDPNIVP